MATMTPEQERLFRALLLGGPAGVMGSLPQYQEPIGPVDQSGWSMSGAPIPRLSTPPGPATQFAVDPQDFLAAPPAHPTAGRSVTGDIIMTDFLGAGAKQPTMPPPLPNLMGGLRDPYKSYFGDPGAPEAPQVPALGQATGMADKADATGRRLAAESGLPGGLDRPGPEQPPASTPFEDRRRALQSTIDISEGLGRMGSSPTAAEIAQGIRPRPYVAEGTRRQLGMAEGEERLRLANEGRVDVFNRTIAPVQQAKQNFALQSAISGLIRDARLKKEDRLFNLNKEWRTDSLVKGWSDSLAQTKKVVDLLDADTGIASMTAVYRYAKMLDDGGRLSDQDINKFLRRAGLPGLEDIKSLTFESQSAPEWKRQLKEAAFIMARSIEKDRKNYAVTWANSVENANVGIFAREVLPVLMPELEFEEY